MEKILGIDLGTNSIGWAIREVNNALENQIIDKGVLTFDKGVGEEKGNEVPLVKARTEARSKRRNYQAEKYRKWELLKFLIEKSMCPLTIEELDAWRKYQKGTGRKYPQSKEFINWLRFDFDGDGKPDFYLFDKDKHESYYIFRALAVSENDKDLDVFRSNPHVLGRVLYQLVQRRGYRGRDDESTEAKTILKGSDENGTIGVDAIRPYIERYKTLGAALYHLQEESNERIRKRYNLRSDYEKELQEICGVQKLGDESYKRLWKAIVWQRPLRSQKGLIGICTFERNKPRCPVSHPLYEEFRTWVFINSLKINVPPGVDRTKYIKENIYPLFYHASKEFKLSSIIKKLDRDGGGITSKYKSDTKALSCTLLYQLNKLFGNDWKNYRVESPEFKKVRKKDGTIMERKASYDIEDIWHVLFTYDSREKLKEFALKKLQLEEEKADEFSKIQLQQGYTTLSLSAIKKILPYLEQGFIYSEAVYLANMHKVLGEKSLSPELSQNIADAIDNILRDYNKEKQLIGIVNTLISDQLNSNHRFGMDSSYELDNDDIETITTKVKTAIGTQTWEKMEEADKSAILHFVSTRYLNFLRKPITAKKEDLFLKLPRKHDKIFNYLKEAYDIPDENIRFLWHPSEQEKYPNAKEIDRIKQLGNPQPVSRGFKNPMALKTLHNLKNLINYLLVSGKIDDDTRIVVEIAREMNDMNRRKAIEKWQRDRESENAEFKKKIKEISDEYGLNLDDNDKNILNKYRLWTEQKQQCLYTGKVINCNDLFDGNRFDFEHTIPASMSYDNELKNLTIADSSYNRLVKQKRIPFDCPNYDEDVTIDGKEYTAIKPRIKFIEEKVEHLEELLHEWKNKSKFASTKEIKDASIQKKHLISFELDYWRKKLDTFTCEEYKIGWRNSQLRDTQVITKYALPYLKTVFNKVDVQKGSITAAFREIYKIQPRTEKKDRSKHSHHAIDAAVLTLIPISSIRDKIYQQYNEEKDRNIYSVYHEQPRNWPGFNASYLLSIEESVLINYQKQNRALTSTKKNVRKRGKIQFVREKLDNGKWQYKLDASGNRIPLVAKGDTIRGQLHKQSTFGAIKQSDEILLVERNPIAGFNSINDCKSIVDVKVQEIVRTELERRIASGLSFDKAKLDPIPFPNSKEVIKKVRCKVPAGRGYLKPKTALDIRKHTFLSKQEHKQYAYAQNEENTLCLYYEGKAADKLERAFKIVGLFELANLKLNDVTEIRREKYYQTAEAGRGKKKSEIPLSYIIQVGTRAIFYNEKNEEIEELKQLPNSEIIKRLFSVYKFNEMGSPYIYLQFHLEARPNNELGDGDTEFDNTKYQHRLKLKADRFTCAIEGKHFIIQPDGEIKWLS